MRHAAALAILPFLVVAGCGGGSGGNHGHEMSAKQIAAKLKADIPSITKTVRITEDNDPNNDIGRPGQYQQATVLYDSRTHCDKASQVDVSCGAKIEVFTDAAGASARKRYIMTIVKAASGLITEYDYVSGAVILRVNGDLKPSEARQYDAAFKKIM